MFLLIVSRSQQGKRLEEKMQMILLVNAKLVIMLYNQSKSINQLVLVNSMNGNMRLVADSPNEGLCTNLDSSQSKTPSTRPATPQLREQHSSVRYWRRHPETCTDSCL